MTSALAGRRVLVTGGHRRIGRALACSLGEQGARVIVQWRSGAAEAETVVAQVRAAGGDAVAVQAELTDSAAVARLVEQAAAPWRGLDAVVACAASWEPTPIDQLDAGQLDRAWATNARAPVDLILRARPWLQASADGRAVLFGDLGGLVPYSGYLAHSMAKAALHAAVAGLAAELAPGVVVNGIVPGAVLRPEAHSAADWLGLQRRVPLGVEALADPAVPVAAVVAAVAYLLTCPRYVAGQLLRVDGGRTARW
ncbi:MAG: SDR family oxidoreductase [Myxococcales bacterium]|nr:SDR family oxidoreductase [Myxococcales bacterium]